MPIRMRRCSVPQAVTKIVDLVVVPAEEVVVGDFCPGQPRHYPAVLQSDATARGVEEPDVAVSGVRVVVNAFEFMTVGAESET